MKIGDHVWIREKDNDVGKMVLSGPYEINGIRTTEEKDQDQDQDQGAVRKPYYQYKIYTGNGSHIWYYASDLFVVRLISIPEIVSENGSDDFGLDE